MRMAFRSVTRRFLPTIRFPRHISLSAHSIAHRVCSTTPTQPTHHQQQQQEQEQHGSAKTDYTHPTSATMADNNKSCSTSCDAGSVGSSETSNSPNAFALSAALHYTISPSEPNMGCPRPLNDLRACDTLASLVSFPKERIRNFALVAHVDHGKTTLTDAILRRTGVLRGADGPLGTYTDRLAVERERGITVKAQTCSLFVRSPLDGEEYLLNLIDTPGHVDFQYEVSRSLAASEAALLLIDVAQGMEAQTMAHFHAALDRHLAIVPVLTKMDAVLDDAPVERTLQELEDSTGLLRREVLYTSAKAQLGVEALLEAILTRVPPPSGRSGLSDPRQLPPLPPGSPALAEMTERLVPLRALVFDAWTEECGGGLRKTRHPSTMISSYGNGLAGGSGTDGVTHVTCLIRVLDGTLTPRTMVHLFHAQQHLEAREVGIIHPELRPTAALSAGMVGYVLFAPTRREDVGVGETLFTLPTPHTRRADVMPIAGFKRVHPVVFAGLYPNEGEYITQLREAVEKLRVNDPAVTLEALECPALGAGLQLGFLGMLHMQVFQERLLAEFGQRVLVTPPQVQYKCRLSQSPTHTQAGEERVGQTASATNGPTQSLTIHTWRWPHEGVVCYLEPYVTATIITPRAYFSVIDAEATRRFRGEPIDTRVIDDARVVGRYKMPLADLVRGFFARVKSLSHGYASLDYDDPTYAEADLVKVDIIVQKSRVSALSFICAKHEATTAGRRIVTVLKENLNRTAVDIPLQALIGSKVIARETVRAYRKDVTAKIHAGDISRKQKKWNDQKKGKERMARRTVGSVTLDQSVLAAAMGATTL